VVYYVRLMNLAGLRAHFFLLAASMLGGTLAACGGGAPAPQTPSTEISPSGADAGAPPITAEPAKPDAAAPSAPTGPAGAIVSTEIVPSKMIADIKAIGIDLANPGDLSKMDMSKKKKLMPFFVKALGMADCQGCHVAGDFKASTHNKQMAAAMWSHFVRDLRFKGGGAMFCDSCHQGKQKLLDRSDKKALSKFMIANYQDKLQRHDKKDHTCETCHSEPFENKVFAKLWKIAP
jgi:hypothetical protein